MAAVIYFLCMLTSLTVCTLLLRRWRGSGSRLLFWSGLCFAGLTLNNFLLVIDKLVVPQVDLSSWRLLVALAAVLMLLFGLIWEEE